jgi:hypothetical protein
MTKKLAMWLVFGLGFVVNPNLACSSSEDEDEFTYTEQDMKTVVLGEWQGTATIGDETAAFTLRLEQASSTSATQSISAPPIRPQCASRSFVKPAGACISITTMPVVGTIASDNPLFDGAVTGHVDAYRDLSGARFAIQLADGKALDGLLLEQTIADGWILESGQIGSFTLARP